MGTLKLQSNGSLYSNTVIGLLYLVQQKGYWDRGAAAPPSPLFSTKCNSPPKKGQCTNFILLDIIDFALYRKPTTRHLRSVKYKNMRLNTDTLHLQRPVLRSGVGDKLPRGSHFSPTNNNNNISTTTFSLQQSAIADRSCSASRNVLLIEDVHVYYF